MIPWCCRMVAYSHEIVTDVSIYKEKMKKEYFYSRVCRGPLEKCLTFRCTVMHLKYKFNFGERLIVTSKARD